MAQRVSKAVRHALQLLVGVRSQGRRLVLQALIDLSVNIRYRHFHGACTTSTTARRTTPQILLSQLDHGSSGSDDLHRVASHVLDECSDNALGTSADMTLGAA